MGVGSIVYLLISLVIQSALFNSAIYVLELNKNK